MKARILFLASILVALVGMLAVPAGVEAEVKEATACPGQVCMIPPHSGSSGPAAWAAIKCTDGCTQCCEDTCPNEYPGQAIVGDPNCYCTVAGTKTRCPPPGK